MTIKGLTWTLNNNKMDTQAARIGEKTNLKLVKCANTLLISALCYMITSEPSQEKNIGFYVCASS